MSTELDAAIADLASDAERLREVAASNIYSRGGNQVERAVQMWWNDNELATLLDAPTPTVNVGLAVWPTQFDTIHQANGSPRLASVPPDQDAKEFELHFANGASLDILTTKDQAGSGAIARYLAKFGQGIQQVEFRCKDVDRATEILRDKFGITPIYPATRPGADGTRINFFLLTDPEGSKVLVELYEPSPQPFGR